MGLHHVPSQTNQAGFPMVKRWGPHPGPKASAVSGEWDPNHRCKAQVLLPFLLMVMVPMCHLELVISVFCCIFCGKNQGVRNPLCIFFLYSVFFFLMCFLGKSLFNKIPPQKPPKTKQFAPENRLKNWQPPKRKVVSQLPEHHFSGTKPRSHARSMPNPCLTSAKKTWLGN